MEDYLNLCSKKNRTDLFLRELDKSFSDKFSPHLIERFKLALLDYLGVTLAGACANGQRLDNLVCLSDEGATPVIGIDSLLSMGNAIFLNGLNAHTLDYDDGTNSGIIHLGSPIFSVLLPLARKYNVPVQKFVKASILGYEASYTIAVSIQPQHKFLGYHATGTCGTIGIALAVAEMLDFSEAQRKNAFTAAAVSATGTLKVMEDGSELKPYNVAKAALMGYTASVMGLAGFSGPDDVLSGDRGFLSLMFGSDDVELKPFKLNGTYALEKAYIKPYAACRYCHPAIEAALMMKKRYFFELDDIDSIRVRTYSLAVNKHDHTEIRGEGSAKMSIPYSVAVALHRGKAGLEEYESEIVSEKAILDLTRRVCVLPDENISRAFPAKQTAIVEIKMKNGLTYSETVDFAKGEPENPLSKAEVREKFTELVLYGGKTQEETDEIFEAVMDLDNQFEKLLDLI